MHKCIFTWNPVLLACSLKKKKDASQQTDAAIGNLPSPKQTGSVRQAPVLEQRPVSTGDWSHWSQSPKGEPGRREELLLEKAQVRLAVCGEGGLYTLIGVFLQVKHNRENITITRIPCRWYTLLKRQKRIRNGHRKSKTENAYMRKQNRLINPEVQYLGKERKAVSLSEDENVNKSQYCCFFFSIPYIISKYIMSLYKLFFHFYIHYK